MKRRILYSDIVTHCYQRSADGGLLFYCYSDYLVFFTGYCLYAKRYNVQVLSLCLMPDHVHDSLVVRRKENLICFKQAFNTWFSKVHKPVCHCDGPLLESPFGSAVKKGDKKARTNLIYVGNNPVERQLSPKAEDYRWNFLAYAQSPHPFSKELVLRESSWPLRKAIKEADAQCKSGKPMVYAQLQRLFKSLTPDEGQQLTDYIITKYNVIDYQAAVRFFDSYEDMLLSMHANTGSEYDINEVFLGKTDAHYAKMAGIIKRELNPADIHDVLGLPPLEKYEVFQLIRKHSTAMSEQIAKFLRMTIKKGPIDES